MFGGCAVRGEPDGGKPAIFLAHRITITAVLNRKFVTALHLRLNMYFLNLKFFCCEAVRN